MVKIYFGLWLAIAVAFLAIFLTGNLTLMALVVFGFIAFGMTFMGMMGVLPTVVTHATHKQAIEKKTKVSTGISDTDRITNGVPIPVKAA